MKKIDIFIFSSIFYISWIFINNFFENIYYSFLVLLIVELFFLVIYLKVRKFLTLIWVSSIAFIIWIFVSNINLLKIEQNLRFIKNFDDKVEIISEIQEIKEIKNWEIVYKWKILSIENQTPENTINSEIFIKEKWYRLKKWQVIKNISKIYVYEDFGWFSYKNYMISNWYYFKQFANKYEKLEKKEIFKLEEKIINFREKLLEIIKEIYPKNEAIFLGWILLWAREELPKELKENFNNSWLTHFIAVSWFNITILIVFFSVFIKYIPKHAQIITMSIIIFIFVILVWPTAPVIRAWLMGFIWYLVLQNGRQWNILSISLLTLLLMVSYNPFSINYDVSLHLSFLAVFWIIYTEKFFNNIFIFLPNIFEIRNAISITLSALVFTLPVMIFNFWKLSTIAPISNLLVSWSIPLAMLLWFLSIIWYVIFSKIWIFIWFFTYLLLKWNISIVNYFWSLEFLVLKTDFWEYKWYFEFIYLISMAFIIMYFKSKEKE